MKTHVPSLVFGVVLVLSGCTALQAPVASPEVDGAAPSTAATDVAPPPPTANTVTTLDTTTEADRVAALDVAPEPAGEAALGTTLATLGSPSDPGIWLKTGLVTEVTQGRVVYQGASINIELRPSGGASCAGSQISLPAMRLLNAPLTGVVELSVFAGAAT